MAFKNIKVTNFVFDDDIWKGHVNKELRTTREFPDKWGFVTEHYKKLDKDVKEACAKTGEEIEATKAKVPQDCIVRLPTPRETDITVVKSPKRPLSDGKMIGWRSGQKDCNLEIYGEYARRNGSLYTQLGWPIEGCP